MAKTLTDAAVEKLTLIRHPMAMGPQQKRDQLAEVFNSELLSRRTVMSIGQDPNGRFVKGNKVGHRFPKAMVSIQDASNILGDTSISQRRSLAN
jgi:hypothetical protein